jgi:hypothetical protein
VVARDSFNVSSNSSLRRRAQVIGNRMSDSRGSA